MEWTSVVQLTEAGSRSAEVDASAAKAIFTSVARERWLSCIIESFYLKMALIVETPSPVHLLSAMLNCLIKAHFVIKHNYSSIPQYSISHVLYA